jgi:Ca2+-binding EF-hand superfamily protein
MREDVEGRQSTYEMSYETKTMMVNILRRCIDAEIEVEAIRQRLCKSLTQTIRSVFDNIDWLNRGYITKNEFKRIIDAHCDFEQRPEMESYSNVDSIEMEALVRRFNKDKANGKVSMPEFIDELTTKMH